MNTVRNVSDRHFDLRPPGIKWPKELLAHLLVQTAHAIDRAASADRQIGHIKGFKRVSRVLAAQGQQILERNAELVLGIRTKVLFDERRGEAVKTCGHGRVSGKDIACSRGSQR